MRRPRLYHRRCPKVKAGDNYPEMAIFQDESTVFVDKDTEVLVVRITFVCPECGVVVYADFR